MKNNKYFFIILAMAILIKLSLFVLAIVNAPQSKFDPDSATYLATAKVLYFHGAFAQEDKDGTLACEVFRTPGYPIFLALLHNLMKIPLSGVILFQIFLTILVALITYKTANEINNKISILSTVIVLYDLPTTVISLRIMTEVLYLFFLSLFTFSFILYLKNGKTNLIILSVLMLVAATYVRPVSYYLPAGIAIFIIYANVPKSFKKVFIQALIFFVIAYSLLGIWQIRNYRCCKERSFSRVARMNFPGVGLFQRYSKDKDSLVPATTPARYYITTTLRAFLSFMTRPGSLKYFNSYPLTVIGKTLAYPWVVFWMIGFLVGSLKIMHNIYYQFIVFMILYFLFVTICNAALICGERFIVPIVPSFAIISSYGWLIISSFLARRRNLS